MATEIDSGRSGQSLKKRHPFEELTQSKFDTTQGRQRSLQCYRCQGYGYRQSECPTKVSFDKGQKSLTPLGQSNQKRTRAIVPKSPENGEEAFTCMNLEKPDQVETPR